MYSMKGLVFFARGLPTLSCELRQEPLCTARPGFEDHKRVRTQVCKLRSKPVGSPSLVIYVVLIFNKAFAFLTTAATFVPERGSLPVRA
jgi:hypothetical protein